MHIAHIRRGTPENLGNLDIIVNLSIYHPYNWMYAGDFGQVTLETRQVAMEKPAHAQTMCTRLLNSKGRGRASAYQALATTALFLPSDTYPTSLILCSTYFLGCSDFHRFWA